MSFCGRVLLVVYYAVVIMLLILVVHVFCVVYTLLLLVARGEGTIFSFPLLFIRLAGHSHSPPPVLLLCYLKSLVYLSADGSDSIQSYIDDVDGDGDVSVLVPDIYDDEYADDVDDGGLLPADDDIMDGTAESYLPPSQHCRYQGSKTQKKSTHFQIGCIINNH